MEMEFAYEVNWATLSTVSKSRRSHIDVNDDVGESSVTSMMSLYKVTCIIEE